MNFPIIELLNCDYFKTRINNKLQFIIQTILTKAFTKNFHIETLLELVKKNQFKIYQAKRFENPVYKFFLSQIFDLTRLKLK